MNDTSYQQALSRSAAHLFSRFSQLVEGLGDPVAMDALQAIVDEVNHARYALAAGWREQTPAEYLNSSNMDFLACVVAAKVCEQQGQYANSLALANRALAWQPQDLYAQRLAESLKGSLQVIAGGQSRWTEADEIDLSTRFCDAPFERLETRDNGDVNFCCDSWLNIPIGNFNTDSTEVLWNSEVAQEIRASILTGKFTYCSRTGCPRILNRGLPRRDAVQSPALRRIIEEGTVVLKSKPQQLKLNHDASCNLSCPSCRSAVYRLDDAGNRRLRKITDEVVLPLLTDARIVEITGSGDAFASKHFRYILKQINRVDYPRLRIDLFTNGIQFTEERWRKLQLHGLCRRAVISVDATEPESYRRLRRGGELSTLLSNFPFIAHLRATGELERVVLVFVIQLDNYRQIPDMVRLTQRYGFDETFLKKLDPWGQTAADYRAKNVTDPEHPNYPDLLAVLRNPILRQPVVNLGTLKPAYDSALNQPLINTTSGGDPVVVE